MPVLIIAEAGVNHNGSPALARQMALAAKQAGADVVKFQTCVPELVASRFAQKAAYQKQQTGAQESQPLRRDTWQAAFAAQLQRYKDDGFERINPSILKADIISSYPDFTEKSIGFRRFSDILKQLEKDGKLKLEMDSQRNMLIKML